MTKNYLILCFLFSIALAASAGPDAASMNSGRLDLFARGTDNALWTRTLVGNTWTNWNSLGGTLNSNPASVSWGSGRIDVFSTNNNNQQNFFWASSLLNCFFPCRITTIGLKIVYAKLSFLQPYRLSLAI